MPEWTRSVSIDGAQVPTWNLVVILVLTLAVETAADIFSRFHLKPDYDGCYAFCDGKVASIGPDHCDCDDDCDDDKGLWVRM